MKPDNVILEGVVGSHAYGLATPESDIDIKGIFVAPTTEVLGLHPPKEIKDHTDPDWVYYEVGKFMKLAMAANPTVLELLFLNDYEKLSAVGKILVDNRHLFLSQRVRKTYGGYALAQARKLNSRGGSYSSALDKRYEKHSRHILRLIYQGRQILETGDLNVLLSEEQREEVFAFGKKSPEEILERFEEEFKALDTIESALPDKPDEEKISQLLVDIRRMYL